MARIQGQSYQNASNHILLNPWGLALKELLALIWFLSHVTLELASGHHHPSMKICKVCNKCLVENELLFACSTYTRTMIDMHINLIFMLKYPSRRMITSVYYIHIASCDYWVEPRLRKEKHRRWYIISLIQ